MLQRYLFQCSAFIPIMSISIVQIAVIDHYSLWSRGGVRVKYRIYLHCTEVSVSPATRVYRVLSLALCSSASYLLTCQSHLRILTLWHESFDNSVRTQYTRYIIHMHNNRNPAFVLFTMDILYNVNTCILPSYSYCLHSATQMSATILNSHCSRLIKSTHQHTKTSHYILASASSELAINMIYILQICAEATNVPTL